MARLEASNSEFGEKTRKMMTYMSPLSLAVVFEQIKRGASMEVRDVFQMEFGIAQGYMHNHSEFFEGVRALLIDKDRSPKWTHANVNQITKDEVNMFFEKTDTCNLDL